MRLIYWLAGSSSRGCCKPLDGAFVDRQFFSHNLSFLTRRDDRDTVMALTMRWTGCRKRKPRRKFSRVTCRAGYGERFPGGAPYGIAERRKIFPGKLAGQAGEDFLDQLRAMKDQSRVKLQERGAGANLAPGVIRIGNAAHAYQGDFTVGEKIKLRQLPG